MGLHRLRRSAWILGVLALSALACAESNCVVRRTLSLQGPEARVVAEAYHGGCPGRGADAQLVLRFRRLRPDSDVVVLERTAVTQLKWLSADRLLVGYASESPGQEREQLVRVADDSVRLILRGTRRLGRFTPPGA